MARPIWKGHISFGLVSIPVGVYPAEKREDLDFRMIDKRNMAPVGYQRINKETGKEVPWNEVVKGYEYEDNKYVLLTKEDFKRADVKATEAIDILHFVDHTEIDPMYFEQPYYVAPAKGGEKGFVLLREALRKSGKVGIAYVVFNNRQHVAALIPHDDIMILDLLRYGYELRDTAGLEVPKVTARGAEVREKELEMAEKLIEGMVEPWSPDKYRDEYRDDLLQMIHHKIETGTTEDIEDGSTRRKKDEAKVVDIMGLLKASLEQAGQTRGGGKAKQEKSEPARKRGGAKARVAKTEKTEKIRKSA